MPDPADSAQSDGPDYNWLIQQYIDKVGGERQYLDELKRRAPDFEEDNDSPSEEEQQQIDAVIEGMLKEGPPGMSPAEKADWAEQHKAFIDDYSKPAGEAPSEAAQKNWQDYKNAAPGSPEERRAHEEFNRELKAHEDHAARQKGSDRDPVYSSPAQPAANPLKPTAAPPAPKANPDDVMKKFINATYGVDADQNPQRELQFAQDYKADRKANPEPTEPHVTTLPVQQIYGDPQPQQAASHSSFSGGPQAAFLEKLRNMFAPGEK